MQKSLISNAQTRRVFVIGPISREGTPTRKRSDNILKLLVKPAVLACDLSEPVRADKIAEPGSITDQVIQHLLEDELVIADLHEQNPNVFYELGVRHTTGKPCILITEKADEIPFDIHIFRTIFVDSTDIASWEAAKEQLIHQIKFIIQNPGPVDTIVTIAFDILTLRRNQGLLDAFSMLEPLRDTRRLIREHMKSGKTWKDLSEPDRLEVDELCRRFDLLGMYDRMGIVNSLHVDFIYGVPFVELYEGFLKDYVEHQRTGPRDKKHFWELVQFYERVKYVPSNHPAETGESDWPKNPRQLRR